MSESLRGRFDDLEAALRAAADPALAGPMSAYMKHHFPFLGVKSPVRDSLSRPLLGAARRAGAGELLAVAEHSWTLAEREFQYVGGDVLRAGAHALRAGDLGRVRNLITTKSWWDTVDLLAAHVVGPMVAAHPELRTVMDVWIDDEDIWVARTAILHQLAYKESLDEARLFAYATKRAGDREFFIRKALGWAMRQHARVAPDAVRDFVAANEHKLSGLTRREATKHL